MVSTHVSIISDCVKELIRRSYTTNIILTLLSVILTLATSITCTTKSRVKNLQVSILRGYLASCIGSMGLVAVLCSEIKADYFQSSIFEGTLVLGIWHFSVSSMFWLNVMGFDIWSNFGESASSQDRDVSEYPESKFLPYFMYAWISPVLILMIAFSLMILLNPSAMLHILLTTMFLSIGGIILCNMLLFILTVSIIRKRKTEKGCNVHGGDIGHEENVKWFASYVILFGMAQLPLILFVAGILGNNPALANLAGTLSAPFQGLCSFAIFSGGDDINEPFRRNGVTMDRVSSDDLVPRPLSKVERKTGYNFSGEKSIFYTINKDSILNEYKFRDSNESKTRHV